MGVFFMTDNAEFKAWRTRMGLTQEQVAEKLGLSLGAVVNYEKGVRRDDGSEVNIKRTVMDMCRNLERKKMAIALIESELPTNGTGKITGQTLREVLVGLVELEIAPSRVDGKKEAKALIEEKLSTSGGRKITAKDLRDTLIGIFELA
jgi:transcriptional regulator with XRE-family HTH domain